MRTIDRFAKRRFRLDLLGLSHATGLPTGASFRVLWDFVMASMGAKGSRTDRWVCGTKKGLREG